MILSSGSSYCSATMLPAASLATPQKRLAHSHLQVHLLDRAWFVDCVGHPAHRMLVLCMIDVCSQCCKNPIRTRIVIADHYSCSLHSKIADDELQTARRNASCPRKVACLAQLARFQTDGSFGLVRSACNKLPTRSAAGIAPEGFWLQRQR